MGFVVVIVLCAWGFTTAKLYDQIGNLEMSRDNAQRYIDHLQALHGEWQTRSELNALLNPEPILN